MEEKSLHIVIVGHVDHGKSTLIGRLFYDTDSISPDSIEEIRKSCKKMGKEFEFAYIMDNFEEERKKGITIDIAHTFFSTKKRRYVIIDAPGHKEFLKNMISGTSQAEAALLLIDISQGIKEQTLRHCFLLSLLGIKQTAVVVNKMDLVDYSESKFEEIKKEITELLAKLDITPKQVIPVSALNGENIAEAQKSEKLSWYNGPTVLDLLESFDNFNVEEKSLRFPVQDVYKVNDQTVTVGRVDAGILKKNAKVTVLPANELVTISRIMLSSIEENLDKAITGDCVGVITDKSLERGVVLVDSDSIDSTIVSDTIHANIFWMIEEDYVMGAPIIFKCATQEAKGNITKIYRRFDPASVDLVETNSDTIKSSEVAEVEIRLEKKVVVDHFSDIPELGRFVLEHAGFPVAGGIII